MPQVTNRKTKWEVFSLSSFAVGEGSGEATRLSLRSFLAHGEKNLLVVAKCARIVLCQGLNLS